LWSWTASPGLRVHRALGRLAVPHAAWARSSSVLPGRAALARELSHLVRRKLRPALRRVLATRGYILLNFTEGPRRRDLALVRTVKREVQLGLDYMDGCQLAMAVRQAMRAPGDLAEVGVFQGGSAKIICENRAAGRALHLFDTFAGIPEVEPIDADHFSVGDWAAPLEQAQTYLSGYDGVRFYPGRFPETAQAVDAVQFAFVSLDVDTFQSTLAGLRFFMPRLKPGGILISDDYRWAPGVRQAFATYFDGRPEPIIELAGSQALVVKVPDSC
jgi:O-methyltransferase